MNKKFIIFLVFLLTLLGGSLRFYKNTTNPVSLSIDEVSYGYSAYSILKTARDENNEFMPLVFRSTGDYKNPLLVYTLVPTIALFGLNEFSVRFTTALFGTLCIPLFFFLLKSLVRGNKVAIVGSTLLTISPWHIYYSRFAHDTLIGLFIIMLGMLFFYKMLEGKKKFIILSAITFALSIYTYHSERIFVPLFLIAYSVFNYKKLKSKSVLIFLLVFSILIIPAIYLAIFKGANIRVNTVFLAQDIDYTRYVILDHIQSKGELLILFFFWVKRYLNYMQPEFLFSNGLNMTINGILGMGIFYLFELPWLLIGIFEIIRKKITHRLFIVAWILIGIIPASLANNEYSASRVLLILPPILLIISVGAVRFFELIKSIKNKYLGWGIIYLYGFFITVLLLKATLIFSIHFPIQRGEAFMEGTKESVLYAINSKNKYHEIVYDPYRGIEAPYIVNIPYMYILFYSKYDPFHYQNEVKKYGNDFFRFDKFTTRRINWREDRDKKGTLFIGSPWSLPLQDLKTNEILKKIYLSNGDLALLIVSPN